VPEHPAADDRGQIHLVGETPAVLFIGQDICRQPQATAGQHRDETMLTEGTDDAIEGHGRDMTDRRAPCQTETAVGGQQSVPGHVGSHLAVAQDEMGQHGKNSLTSRALNAPDGKPLQTDAHIMGVASQTTAAVTGRFVVELQADGEDEGEDKLNKRCGVVQERKVGRLIVDSTVRVQFWRVDLAALPMCYLHLIRPRKRMRYDEDNALKDQGNRQGFTAAPLKAMECEAFDWDTMAKRYVEILEKDTICGKIT